MNSWINQIWKAGQVNKGGIVRRSRDTVLKYTSEATLRSEVDKKGYKMILAGEQYIIICLPTPNIKIF
jgi:hypothetical protein